MIVPIAQKNKDKPAVTDAAANIASTLESAGIRVKIDDAARNSPGWKFAQW